MGLPLYVPPVESDAQSKSPAKSPAETSHNRSPIRRAERRRQVVETREQRLRILTALSDSSQHLPGVSLQRSSPSSLPRPGDTRRPPRSQSPGVDNLSELAQHIERRRRRARLAIGHAPRDLALDDLGGTLNDLSHVIPSHLVATVESPPDASPSERPRYLFGLASARLSIPSNWRRETDPEAGPVRRSPSGRTTQDHRVLQRRIERGNRQTSIDSLLAVRRHLPRFRYVYLDGLGDRDRSLSPDGEGAWDTLQSTLTPDPQPPSAGSSFASATVPVSRPQPGGDNSVNTTIANPNEETEPPCDPVPNNSSSDDDNTEPQMDEPAQQPGPQARLVFAHVATDPPSSQTPESGDANDIEREWLSGMHRIVRALASRSDIPDEWWAQAGLSRSMSWDDPN